MSNKKLVVSVLAGAFAIFLGQVAIQKYNESKAVV